MYLTLLIQMNQYPKKSCFFLVKSECSGLAIFLNIKLCSSSAKHITNGLLPNLLNSVAAEGKPSL